MVNRAQTFDLLKGLAVVLMIQVHIVELFATQEIFNSRPGAVLLFLGGPPVAPVFVAIMGYFLAASKKSTSQLLLRGLKVICLGMLLNIALNLNLIISVNKGLLQLDLLPYIFGVDILQFAGLAIMVIAILRKALMYNLDLRVSGVKMGFKYFPGIVVFGIVMSVIVGYLMMKVIPENPLLKYVSAFFYGSAHWSYFPLFPWLSYPLAGFAFCHIQKNYDLAALASKNIKVLFGILFILFLVFTFNYALGASSQLETYYHHGALFTLWIILFMALYGFVINTINDVAGNFFLMKYLKWLGKNVTLIYVIQWIIIGNVATEIYKTVSSPVYLLGYFAGILIVSSGIAFAILLATNRLMKKKA